MMVSTSPAALAAGLPQLRFANLSGVSIIRKIPRPAGAVSPPAACRRCCSLLLPAPLKPEVRRVPDVDTLSMP